MSVRRVETPETAVEPYSMRTDVGGDIPPSTAKVKVAAATALAAAAVKARLLADEEEKQVQELMQRAVTAQSKLVEQHLQRFEQLQQALSQERTSLAVSPSGVAA